MESRKVEVVLIVSLMLEMLVIESITTFSPRHCAHCLIICNFGRRGIFLCSTIYSLWCLRQCVSSDDKDGHEQVGEKCMLEGRSN